MGCSDAGFSEKELWDGICAGGTCIATRFWLVVHFAGVLLEILWYIMRYR
jgi:hypothetical protein